MNAFALILLGWPIYLAVNGRLSDYVNLAKPSQMKSASEGGDSSESSPSTLDDVLKGIGMGSA